MQVLDQITDRLYNQTMDAQDGVIYFLLDQMADQHVKEQLLAYFVLLLNGRILSNPPLSPLYYGFKISWCGTLSVTSHPRFNGEVV